MLQYSRFGHGPLRVLALHGLLQDRLTYEPMLEAIDPARWSIALPDLRGYGKSSKLGGPFTMATAASDALEICEHLGWKDFVVIGHSMGGKIALRLAIDAPERVSRILAVSPLWAGPIHFEPEQLEYFRSSADRIEIREELIARTTGNRLPEYWCRRAAMLSAEVSIRDAYAGYIESFVFDDFEAEAVQVDKDVLVVAGALDAANLEMVQTQWIAKLPHAELVNLGDCGHWCVREAPLLLAGLLERFVPPISTV